MRGWLRAPARKRSQAPRNFLHPTAPPIKGALVLNANSGVAHYREIALSLAAIVFTLMIAVFVGRDTGVTFAYFEQSGHAREVAEFIIFTGILLVLLYGCLVYLHARLFYFARLREVDAAPKNDAPMRQGTKLTILVPSYREDKSVIWRTLVSAAMVEHPDRRAVLLVDDPPDPRRLEDIETLEASRAVAGEVQALFAPVARRMSAGVAEIRSAKLSPADRNEATAALFDEAAEFLERLARDVDAGAHGGVADHTRAFFALKILSEPASQFRARAAELRAGGVDAGGVEADLDRLGYLFRTKLEFFERKLYVNTPKGADKATNLNAYLSMMGRRCELLREQGGLRLADLAPGAAATGEVMDFPDSDYVLVLDADSIVTPCYARTLLAIMEAPEGQRIGVAQTPYLTFPNATSMLERVAGATTDIQFIIHQGMGALGAGFWVGANALVRMTAFREIARPTMENGFLYHKFVQDRTVIEDTGSTIDLRAKGWSVHNHVHGLAWSATPPDFGTLTIQRRRWANGGLILLPDLFSYFRRARFSRAFLGEAFMRFHYLASQAFASVGVLALLLYPFDDRFASSLLPLTAIPYFLLYGRDLKRLGYQWTDLPRVYALNLMLLPVILAGVLKSIQQILFGVKTPFARTPKVAGRTASPALYLGIEIALFGWMLMMFKHDVLRNDREHAFFALTSAFAFFYGFIEMIGLEALAEDLAIGLAKPFSAFARRLEPLAIDWPGMARQARVAALSVAGLLATGASFLFLVRQ